MRRLLLAIVLILASFMFFAPVFAAEPALPRGLVRDERGVRYWVASNAKRYTFNAKTLQSWNFTKQTEAPLLTSAQKKRLPIAGNAPVAPTPLGWQMFVDIDDVIENGTSTAKSYNDSGTASDPQTSEELSAILRASFEPLPANVPCQTKPILRLVMEAAVPMRAEVEFADGIYSPGQWLVAFSAPGRKTFDFPIEQLESGDRQYGASIRVGDAWMTVAAPTFHVDCSEYTGTIRAIQQGERIGFLVRPAKDMVMRYEYLVDGQKPSIGKPSGGWIQLSAATDTFMELPLFYRLPGEYLHDYSISPLNMRTLVNEHLIPTEAYQYTPPTTFTLNLPDQLITDESRAIEVPFYDPTRALHYDVRYRCLTCRGSVKSQVHVDYNQARWPRFVLPQDGTYIIGMRTTYDAINNKPALSTWTEKRVQVRSQKSAKPITPKPTGNYNVLEFDDYDSPVGPYRNNQARRTTPRNVQIKWEADRAPVHIIEYVCTNACSIEMEKTRGRRVVNGRDVNSAVITDIPSSGLYTFTITAQSPSGVKSDPTKEIYVTFTQ